MDLATSKPGQKFIPQVLNKAKRGGIGQIEELFRGMGTGQIRAILCQRQVMSRSIDFRDDRDSMRLS